MNNNKVDIVTLGSLLNGKNHFLVPSYQRGYRWNRKQIEDLLGDLYSFKKVYESRQREGVGEFYCLQPVIVREIVDPEVRAEILGTKGDDPENKLWELIDGQQRMTSIFILISYLLSQKHIDREGFRKRYRAELYSLYYESRPDTRVVLDSLLSGEAPRGSNIDAVHIINAYHYIDEWFDSEGKGVEISKRYVGGDGELPEEMWDNLLSQIVTKAETGSTKVIWYELSNSEEIDPVQEFTRINNGKIPLTDTELVKALFLQKKNYLKGEKILQQAKVSLQWEQIENSLQRNDFWCFISDKGTDYEDRMGELLKLVHISKGYSRNSCASIELGDIFRYYYSQLDGLESEGLQSRIKGFWTDIMDTYRRLEDWFESPEIYNYVGYLIHSGGSLPEIFVQGVSNDEKGQATVDSFISILEDDIRNILPRNCVEKRDDGSFQINVEYPNRPELRKLLLLLNVDLLSQQLRKIRTQDKYDEVQSDANVFKFPYDLYKSQNWDIEHIDSATTNDLTDKEAQKAWVENAIRDAKIEVSPTLQKKMDNGEWKDLIGIIQQHENEDLENKNFIGNLTLLDSGTNREYKNDLFCQKRSKIIERVKNGRYILTCTQYVFMKFFDDDTVTESRTKWTREDQQKYHSFILKQLERFLIPQIQVNE